MKSNLLWAGVIWATYLLGALAFLPFGAVTAQAREEGKAPLDIVVWSDSGSGPVARWVEVSGDTATVVAERKGAVVSDGRTLWELHRVAKKLKMDSCESLETGKKGPSAGTATVVGLSARPIFPKGKDVVLMPAESSGGGYGEVWANDAQVQGSAGAVVSIYKLDSGYGCGAHGYEESGRHLVAANSGKRVELGSSDIASLRRKALPLLKAEVRKLECADTDDFDEESVFLDGVSYERRGGRVVGVYHFVSPSGADWNFVCSVEQTVEGEAISATPEGKLDQSAQLALQTAKAEGVVGWARLSLRGTERASALDAFSKGGGSGEPASAAGSDAPTRIAEGRKATKAKEYTKAIEHFTAAIEADATAARAWSGRGYARQLAGELDAAKADFVKALELDSAPTFQGAIWFNLGGVEEARGDRAAARKAYEKANALAPSDAARKKVDALK